MLGAFLAIFLTVFLAELGDKTQLATVLFSAEGRVPVWLVFLAAASALIASTAIAVLLGTLASEYLKGLPLKVIAGTGFILIGLWTVWDGLRPAG